MARCTRSRHTSADPRRSARSSSASAVPRTAGDSGCRWDARSARARSSTRACSADTRRTNMKRLHGLISALAMLAVALGGWPAAAAADAWAGQTFLSDYSKLQPAAGKGGRDYVYLTEVDPERMGRFRKVLLDQPEVFIAADSPYKGAKPADLAAIAGVIRSSVASALESRGYALVDQPSMDAVYVRLAVTDLRIDKKKRGLLAYTPVGFVVSTGVEALQDFTAKYDILDMALQVEVQDSTRHDVLGAAVVQRGRSADHGKPLSFDALSALVTEYGERMACRLDNSHVTPDRRIDCLDAEARRQPPRVLGP